MTWLLPVRAPREPARGDPLEEELAAKDALGLVQLWLRAQTNLWLPEVRYWLALPAMANALEGVLRYAETTIVQVHDGAIEGHIDANGMVVVHHPIDGAASPRRTPAPT